jgi:hypothetical protein
MRAKYPRNASVKGRYTFIGGQPDVANANQHSSARKTFCIAKRNFLRSCLVILTTQRAESAQQINTQIKEYGSHGAMTDQSRNIQNKACIAFPNTTRMHFQRLKCTDQGMQLQTSPQQLGTVPNARRIYKARHYMNAFPNTQQHIPRNATPNIAPTTQCA